MNARTHHTRRITASLMYGGGGGRHTLYAKHRAVRGSSLGLWVASVMWLDAKKFAGAEHLRAEPALGVVIAR